MEFSNPGDLIQLLLTAEQEGKFVFKKIKKFPPRRKKPVVWNILSHDKDNHKWGFGSGNATDGGNRGFLSLRRTTGEVKVETIYKDVLEEKKLKMGDIYSNLACSTFYMSFFISYGKNRPSVLAGFNRNTVKTAFNVYGNEFDKILTRQRSGPIVSIADEYEPRMWASLIHLKKRDSLQQLYDIEEEENTWVWRKLMNSILRIEIASRSGPMEFFRFTTSARKNWPQFLVGTRSILQTMKGPELAMAFGNETFVTNPFLKAYSYKLKATVRDDLIVNSC
ncbi:hypothetical protein GIB67_002557 [Kingdonia uniflora]|uniref:Uncharacterized protein n=1 Tax=Kingdonia uniflora TaxID=39325 RepID=A0A7J7N956_9MAGN|nr:hypothetical protein GIB67_002557 [Kingdonia uniflora]